MLLSSDTATGITKSMGLALIGFADAFEALQPDILVILGDRFEILAAVSAALIARIPVAHVHGGELTTGAVDDSIRHAVTKLSHLHFVSTQPYRERVIQLGEPPERVFNVGALGVENIRHLPLMSRRELASSIDFDVDAPFLLVTFHPATTEVASAAEQFEPLLEALEALEPPIRVIFTKANADRGGRAVNKRIDAYVLERGSEAIAFTSMGAVRYLSAMQYATAVVGNSSSGILEAPSFRVPTLNIGTRQQGRVRAHSVIDVGGTKEAIADGLRRALSPEFRASLSGMSSPYEGKDTAARIKETIKRFVDEPGLVTKTFHDLPGGVK